MIQGSVDQALEATVILRVGGLQGPEQQVLALIDTGFNGLLTLPAAMIASLGLPWLNSRQGQLADGSLHVFDVYAAVVWGDGRWRGVETEESDAACLIGMAMLENPSLRMDIVPGGEVQIKALP